MTIPDMIRVKGLYRYPVKGLSPEELNSVQLAPGEAIAFDRAYAIENGTGRFNAAAPRYLPKINFLMLMRNERLATLTTRFEDATGTLTIARGGKQLARGNLGTPTGRQLIEQFLAAYMKDDLRGAPKIVAAPGHSFSDVAAKCLHIVNLASVRELERAVGRPVDPLRFRPNLILEGLPAWEEFKWLDREIEAGAARTRRIRPHHALRSDQRRSGDWRARSRHSGGAQTHLGACRFRRLRERHARRAARCRRRSPSGLRLQVCRAPLSLDWCPRQRAP